MKAVIVGKGRMGGFFADLFSSWGWRVESYDILPERSTVSRDQLSYFDIFLISVPQEVVGRVIEEIRPYIRGETLVIDISSIKRHSANRLRELKCEKLILHPMFGHDTGISGSVVIVLECKGKKAKIVLDLMQKSGMRLFSLPLEEHDERMAVLQGLPVLTLLFVPYYLSRKGLLDDVELASPHLKIVLELSSRIIQQNSRVYDSILKNLFDAEKDVIDEFYRFIDALKDEGVEKLRKELQNRLKGNLHREIVEISKLRNVKREIGDLRSAIDVIDSLILSMLERRVSYAKILAELKVENSRPLIDPNIEKERIFKIISKSNLNPVYLEKVFRDIIELTKNEELEYIGISKKIAVLGPEGSFSEEAGLKLVGSKSPLLYCTTISEVFAKVESGEAEFGIVPIENSMEGVVGVTFDELAIRDVQVIGETKIKVELCLAGFNENLKEIKTIYSHPVAIAQCMRFIQTYLPHAEIKFTNSTSEAAKMIDETSAAILSQNAAVLHRLKVIKESIQDSSSNFTRFYLISKYISKYKTKTEGNVTGLIFSVEDKAGALVNVLKYFAEKGINMRMLVSRPSRVFPEYMFLVEVEKNLSSKEVGELQKRVNYLKIFGRFNEIDRLSLSHLTKP